MDKQILANLPVLPGVYLMKDKDGNILYIGKAVSLNARVRSYFLSGTDHSERIRLMLSKMKILDWIITENEIEALALESNLIKKHKPPFNVDLKDDKHFPFLRFSVQETFPLLTIVRKVKKDQAIYFGPYISGGAIKPTLKFIHRNFPLRQCKKKMQERPCLNYQMKRCSAPCAGIINKDDYARMVQKVILFLKGRDNHLLKELKSEMEKASAGLNFEQAAKIRDQIQAIEQIMKKQKVISTNLTDRDIITTYLKEESGNISLLFIRGGKLIGYKNVKIKNFSGLKKEEIFSSFVKQYYIRDTFIPDEIIIEEKIAEQLLIEEWLSIRKGERVKILIPQRGEKLRLIELGQENARADFLKNESTAEKKKLELKRIKDVLGLKNIPFRIEAFDLSHISGHLSTGAMVVFEKGDKVKSAFRHYRIKTVKGTDDYAMLKEVFSRRYKRAIKEKEKLSDLIIVDGGRGQLNSAWEVFRKLNQDISGTDIIGIAKGKERNNPDTDVIYMINYQEPIPINGLHLLQEIRNEAHRFARAYHIKLRKLENLNHKKNVDKI